MYAKILGIETQELKTKYFETKAKYEANEPYKTVVNDSLRLVKFQRLSDSAEKSFVLFSVYSWIEANPDPVIEALTEGIIAYPNSKNSVTVMKLTSNGISEFFTIAPDLKVWLTS